MPMAATSRHRGGRPLLALLLAACATRAAGGLLKAADVVEPLFQITLSLDGGRQEVFRVAAGEDPLAAAHAKAAALSFTAEQTDALVAAAREYAQRARVLPVAELRLAPEHGDALVVIFEGDTTPELRAKVLEAGVPAEKADAAVLDLVLRLQRARVIPVTSASVGSGGEPVQIYFLDDVPQLAANLAAERGLSAAAAAELLEALSEVAVRHRAVPIVRVPVQLASGAAPEDFMLFQGDTIADAVASYIARLGGDANPRLEASLMAHATKLAVAGNHLPYVRHSPAQRPKDGQPLPALVLYAREDAPAAVAVYAAEHSLSEAEAEAVLAAVVQAGKAAGVVPLLSLAVRVVPPAQEGGSADEPAATAVTFDLYDGEDVGAAGKLFCQKYHLSEDGCSLLLDRVTLLAQAEHILPVLTMDVDAATPDGAPVAVKVQLYNGEDPARHAAAAANAAGLNATQAEAVVAVVTRAAQQRRLVPALRLKLADGDKERLFELWYGDNVTESVEAYVSATGLPAPLAAQLRLRAEQEARANRLVPLLRVPVRVAVGGDLESQHVELFEGEDVAAEVAVFAKQHRLAEEDHAAVREVVLREAKVAGFLPLMTVAVNFTGGMSGPLDVFYGDSVETAAVRFEERLGEPDSLPRNARSELRELVTAEGVRRRVFPLYKGAHSAGGKDFTFELYYGDDIAAVVGRSAAAAALGADDTAALVAAVKVAAAKAKALPAMSVPVQIDDKSQATIQLYLGDDIAKAVTEFGREHGLDDSVVANLQGDVQRRAEMERLVPLMAVPVAVAAGAPPMPLQLFEGDNVEAAVDAFMAANDLPPARRPELAAALTAAAQERRLLPLHEVPVSAKRRDGTAVDAMFFLFKGEELRDAAVAFIAKHGLPQSALPELVMLLEQQIRAQAAAEAPPPPPTASQPDEL